MTTVKQHHLKGRPSNRTLPQEEGKRSMLVARCETKDKAMWVKLAQSKGMKLTDWVIEVLNKEVK
jgi:hypothetical protein